MVLQWKNSCGNYISAEARNLTMANIEEEDDDDDKEQDSEEVEPPKRKMIATLKVRPLFNRVPSLAASQNWHQVKDQSGI